MENFSSSFRTSLTRVVAVAALSTVCLGAQAQQITSLEAACPGASEQLANALDRVAREHREPAQVSVSMRVQSQRTLGVEILGADGTYERAVRRAVRGLKCSATATPAQVNFALQFAVPPAVAAAPSAGSALAMRAQPQASAVASR